MRVCRRLYTKFGGGVDFGASSGFVSAAFFGPRVSAYSSSARPAPSAQKL